MGFTCTVCGRHHEEELRDIRAELPEAIHTLPAAERERWSVVSPSGDFATLVDGHTRAETHFVRALLEVPIPEEDDVFGWGVWVRLEEPDMRDVAERWSDAGSEGRSYPGRLATELPAYGRTVDLEGTLSLRTVDLLPGFTVAEPTHPLAVEQRAGITLARARALAEPYRQA